MTEVEKEHFTHT